ncbi:alpha/beta hydrolase [Actinoplanes lobatus]|uniref:Alpha/beta hydrolase n=1 Tax=Actinoplanes lobatus TaxID=113568 RepID=A0A7W7HMT9_9ACTN|nr:alpha/beta hydrolase [Actinoplanes lobatus]MBB4753371.1 pimeloyl-ACP methyl ester carboxylesterase [Actinoplanes lobatus]GGN59845.1 alpha/beta hydrolase [Actinoplanes lobatus]GIE37905.1 alpha/beta hydrolase [Actinoplanes lobatus]
MGADQSLDINGRVLRYCVYGPADGTPVIAHNGTPSTRWRRPDQIETMHRAGVRVLMPDRPGYGGSTRRPGRSVADAAGDARALADAQGWERFAVFGGSGGGPHALACAALLPDRVTRCAVLSGIRPSEPADPPDERTLRPELERISRDIMDRVAAGGPEMPGMPPGRPARDDPEAMARLRATFTDSYDGWVDDKIAFARPWGFAMPDGTVPVGVWYGSDDPHVPGEHARWLLENIPGAREHRYAGGHVPGPETFRQIYDWLRAPAG